MCKLMCFHGGTCIEADPLHCPLHACVAMSALTAAAGFSAVPRQRWQCSNSIQPALYDNWGALQSILVWPHAYPALHLLQHTPSRPAPPPHLPALVSVDTTVPDTAKLHIFLPQQQLCDPHAGSDFAGLFHDLAAAGAPSVRFSALPNQAVAAARQAFTAAGYTQSYINPCWRYLLAGPVPGEVVAGWRAAVASLPPGCALDVLQPADLPLVDDLWTFKSDTSAAFLGGVISRGNTSCVRPLTQPPSGPSSTIPAAHTSNSSSSTHVEAPLMGAVPTSQPQPQPQPQQQDPPPPLAWVLEVEPGGILGVAHTLATARRQGHARRVLAALLLRLADQQEGEVAAGRLVPGQQHLAAYVVDGNTPSEGLLSGLGLNKAGGYTWLGFSRPARPHL